MKLYYLPIEPYETRYTKDWITQFENEFKAHNIPFETILGTPVTQKIINGTVLDACGTHIYKFAQLDTIIKKINLGEIHDNDVIFFADAWFPGIESLFYIRNITNIKYKIYGIFHAGTYDNFDFTYKTGMRTWGKYFEASVFDGLDKIFVATEFHKNLLCSKSICDGEKVIVTGIPFYADELRKKYLPTNKENILVFPHRLETEKNPELFDKLCTYLRQEKVDFTPVKTLDVTKNRDEYFKILAKSKVMVSFADQETFGYSTVESAALDNIVVVPNKLSYVETIPTQYRYNNVDEAFKMVKNALQNYEIPSYNLTKWKYSIDNMLKEMNFYKEV